MARFTSIGMPRKQFVASTAEEAYKSDPSAAQNEAGPSTEQEGLPKKKTHRAGKKLQQKRARAKIELQEQQEQQEPEMAGVEAIADGEVAGSGSIREQEIRAQTKAIAGAYAGVRNGSNQFQNTETKVAGSASGSASASGKGWGKNSEIARRTQIAEERSEARRLQRIQEKQAALTCFACRESGHTARDCPNTLESKTGEDNGTAGILGLEVSEGNQGAKASKGGEIHGGKCYRCNSHLHSLSQCRKPINPDNPTPYATCYVCLASGHLSSACPKNAKGVYVNGGSCKICGSVQHLVRNCPQLKAEEAGSGEDTLEGEGSGSRKRAIGADEDDEMISRFEETRRKELDGNAKKRKKHAPNNNGLREVYKKDVPGLSGSATGKPVGVVGEAKPKAKVVKF